MLDMLSRRFLHAAAAMSMTLGAMAYVACTDAQPNAQPGCTAGQTQACTCVSGTSSTQTCLPDGTYAACSCGPLPDATPLDLGSDTATDAATDADTMTDGGAGDETIDASTDTGSDVATDATDETLDAAPEATDETGDAGLDVPADALLDSTDGASIDDAAYFGGGATDDAGAAG